MSNTRVMPGNALILRYYQYFVNELSTFHGTCAPVVARYTA